MLQGPARDYFFPQWLAMQSLDTLYSKTSPRFEIETHAAVLGCLAQAAERKELGP